MSALTHLYIYYYYNLFFSFTVPNLAIHHFCVLTARHVSVNQEHQKRKHPLNICEGTSEGDLFSGLSKTTETAHLCSIQNMQLSVKFSFTQLSLDHLFSKSASLPLCLCAVQCKSSGCIYVVSVLSVTECVSSARSMLIDVTTDIQSFHSYAYNSEAALYLMHV